MGPIFQVCLRHYNNNNSHLPRAMSTTSTGTRRQHQVVHLPKEHKFVIRFEDGGSLWLVLSREVVSAKARLPLGGGVGGV